MTTDADGGPAGTPERSLVLDELEERLSRFRLLRKQDSAEAEAFLQGLGATSGVDQTIVLELSSTRALGHPDRFWEAHALAIRSIEVLDRNATRGVKVPAIGPLDPVASWAVGLVTRFVVRSHQRALLDAMGRLYANREATCAWDDPDRPLLTRARTAVDRVSPRLQRNPIGVPAFLLGGAFVSSSVSLLNRTVQNATRTTPLLVALVVAAFLLFLGTAWSVLRGAAIARRRISLTTERPIAALWETIGRCGTPPRDQSRQFVVMSLVITILAWVIIPVGVVGVVL